VRLIPPLVELLVGAGTDERQLSEKTINILTSRIGKLKDVPSSIHSEKVIQVLGDLHVRARKAHDAKLVAMLSQCILYLSRLLLHFQLEEPVLQVYRDSLLDFATRKASTLNPAFFQAFFQKYPCSGWKMKDTVIEASTQSVNGFRQCQCLQLFQHILNQITLTVSLLPRQTNFMYLEQQIA
jgi:DNA polymerase phi